jgi:hypothetical protein
MMRQFELVERVKAYDPDADEDLLNRAYVFGIRAHGNQKRDTGDPYFSHPLEVAGILTDLKLDDATIVTALLHDTIEDTDTTHADIELLFGLEIADLVDGVTKLSKIEVQSEETKQAETAGGYAKEMSDAYKAKQAALIAETIKKQDIVITTALIPGRPAPVLLTEQMVRSMKPGSIIIDLAAEQGGNCPLTKAGETIVVNGVKIVGAVNLAGRLSADASSLYARNLFNFLSPMIDKATRDLKIDWNDDIIKGTCLTRDGEVIHPAVKG